MSNPQQASAVGASNKSLELELSFCPKDTERTRIVPFDEAYIVPRTGLAQTSKRTEMLQKPP